MAESNGQPKYVPLRRLVPNMITTAALCCGVAALHFASKAAAHPGDDSQDWTRALVALAFAAVLDALDGRAARFLRVSSPFGATLDSLIIMLLIIPVSDLIVRARVAELCAKFPIY